MPKYVELMRKREEETGCLLEVIGEHTDQFRNPRVLTVGGYALRAYVPFTRYTRDCDLLAARGIDPILVEGGSRIITSFLKERFVSKVYITMAPILIGQGVPAIGDLGIRSMREVITPLKIKTKKRGEDLVWELDLETDTR